MCARSAWKNFYKTAKSRLENEFGVMLFFSLLNTNVGFIKDKEGPAIYAGDTWAVTHRRQAFSNFNRNRSAKPNRDLIEEMRRSRERSFPIWVQITMNKTIHRRA